MQTFPVTSLENQSRSFLLEALYWKYNKIVDDKDPRVSRTDLCCSHPECTYNYRAMARHNVPALPKTKWASIERLMLLEQTTPKDNFDFGRKASGGGIPGGVEGRASLLSWGGMDAVLCMLRRCYKER